MKKFAILGLGTFGMGLAKALTEKGAEVIAVDRNMHRVEEIQDYVSVAVRLDSTDENALISQGIHEVDVAIVCIGEDFESNLLTSVLLKQLGVPLVITRATRPVEEKILNAVGIDRVVIPEQEVSERLAYSLMHPQLNDILYLAGHITLAELNAPKFFVNKSLEELRLRTKYGVNLVIIRRSVEAPETEGQTAPPEQVLIPGADTVIQENDILVVVGRKEDINKFLSAG